VSESPPKSGHDTRLTRPAGGIEPGVLSLSSTTVRVVHGPDKGHEITIVGRPITIGKGDSCDLRLTDTSVSRMHATITASQGLYAIEDLGSTNGTEIDGVAIQKAPLKPGCRIRLGDTTLEFAPGTRTLKAAPSRLERLDGMVGSSEAMRAVYGQIEMVAPTEVTVVLRGETGTGKEVAARAIHNLSPRRGAAFVVFDCANVERELLGSGLFGHRKGAFTGAVADHKGAFEQAHGGTLFLDEVGELPLETQARLLGALQRREVQPLGATAPKAVDVRVLAATHRDLEAMVKDGRFREDLYFRLVVMVIELPPLRTRASDVAALAREFVQEIGGRSGRACTLSDDAAQHLTALPWRGNVRQLRNRIERATVLARDGVIRVEHVSSAEPGETSSPPSTPRAAESPAKIRDVERQAIVEAIERCGGNKTAAARELGISVSTIKRTVKEYGLE
jgi:transcriptional regulator with GAF, ATPase, and Fis domain